MLFIETKLEVSDNRKTMSDQEIYADLMIKQLNLNNKSQVVELASNDGYLLQYFMQSKIKRFLFAGQLLEIIPAKAKE